MDKPLKLSYTDKQIRPLEEKRRGAPQGNKNAKKPESKKAVKVQGYISQNQMATLIELEKKLSAFCTKKRLRSTVIGVAIEILNLLNETIPTIMYGDETMNQPFLIAENEGIWTVVDILTGHIYTVSTTTANGPIEFSQGTVIWDGSTAVQLAQQFAMMVMARKNDQLGQRFKMAVEQMISGESQ